MSDNLRTGWFLLLSSLASFCRVKRWEKSIRAASISGTTSPDPSQTPTRIIPEMFIFRTEDETEEGREEGRTMTEAEIRLTQDLRAAGLL